MPKLHTRQDRQRSYRTVLQGFGQLHDVLQINFVHHQRHMQTLLVPKLVAIPTTLRHSASARFSLDSLTPKTHASNFTAYRLLSYKQSYSPSKAKASYGKLRPKIGCRLPWQRPSAPVESNLTHDSLAPSEPTTQTASRSVQPYLLSSPQSVPIVYNGTLLSPSKLTLPMGGS